MSHQSIFEQVALPDPALIPARIIEGHRRENRAREGDGLIALIAYSIRVQMEPTPTDDMAFKDMLDNGLTSALITCMLDEHLCGFTKAELTSCQGGGLDLYLKNIVPYINRLLPGITALIAFLRGYQIHPRDSVPENLINASMYTMWCASHRFWRALWEIRTPFIDSQPRDYPDADGSPIRLQYGLHRLSAVLSSYEHAMRPSYPQPTPVVPNCRQHVMLTLWLHAEKRRDRNHSLIEAKLAVAYEEFHFGDTAWTDLYESAVADHAEGREQLLSATVRGFRAEDNIGKTMQSLLTFVCDLRPAHELDEARRKNLIPRQVLIASIAGWRTQTCMNDARGIDGEEVVIYNALRLQFNYLASFLVEQHSGPQELPERHVLGVVLLISQYIGNIMLTEDPMLFPQICSIMIACRGYLRRYRSQPRRSPRNRAELEMLRWRMTVTWSSTLNKLNNYRNSSYYQRGRRAWMSLREPLEVTKYTNQVPERDGPPGPDMCAWDECECHYHRPIHPMRVCTGCHIVAYCNAHCQEKDWEKGHGSLCRGRRRTST